MSDPALQGSSKSLRLGHGMQASGNLRDTLSGFGDDVVQIRDPRLLLGVETDSALWDENRMMPTHFERVPSADVGVRSSRWRKAIIAGLVSSSSSKNTLENQRQHEVVDDNSGRNYESNSPPFWGVRARTREQISGLSFHLILHEIACFTSPILTGCLVMALFSGTSHDDHWSAKIYEPTVTFLLVLTCIGFLLRIDTLNSKSLLTSPFLLIPSLTIAVSMYLTKSWTLQASECLHYWGMNNETRALIHLAQNCEFSAPHMSKSTHSFSSSVVEIIMKIVSLISSSIISTILFIFRNDFFVIKKFKMK